MPVLTVRPNGTISAGSWTIVGAATIHAGLADDLDTSYIQNANRCLLSTQLAKIAIADVALPTGAKIFSVRTSIRTERITGGILVFQPQCIILFIQQILEAAFTRNITRIYQLIFSFLAPRNTVAGWTTTQLGFYLEQPAGGEWTQTSFNAFEVHLGREFLGPNLKISELYVDVDYNERPTVTPTAPTGSVTTTTRPDVTWTYADADGDRQQAYRVRVFTAAQYGAGTFDPLVSTAHTESGWLKGADLTWPVARDLVNGAYRAYAQVEQVWAGIGLHQSLMAFTAWTQAVPGPGAPVLAAVWESGPNRVRIDLAAGPTPATETYDIEYSDDVGLTWAFIRNGRQLIPDGLGNLTVYDYAARLNRARRYRAQAFRTLGTIKVGSDYSNLVDVTPLTYLFWLKDPLAPSLNMVLPLMDDNFNIPRAIGVFKPLVADSRTARAIVVAGPVYGREGSWDLVFPRAVATPGWDTGQVAWDKLTAIRSSGRVLLWQLPTGEQFYVALGPDSTTNWDVRADAVHYRKAKFSYVETDPPLDATTS